MTSSNDWAGVLGIATMLASIAAWLTHVVICITSGSWGFLIAGAVFFPVGIIHGVMVWIGVA